METLTLTQLHEAMRLYLQVSKDCPEEAEVCGTWEQQNNLLGSFIHQVENYVEQGML